MAGVSIDAFEAELKDDIRSCLQGFNASNPKGELQAVVGSLCSPYEKASTVYYLVVGEQSDSFFVTTHSVSIAHTVTVP